MVFLERPRWKTRPPKDNKYVVNQKLQHVDDISFREFLVDDARDNLKSTLYEHIIHVQDKRYVWFTSLLSQKTDDIDNGKYNVKSSSRYNILYS